MGMPFASEAASDLLPVRTFAAVSEATVAAAALDAFGIECTLSSDDCGGLRPSLGWASGIRLLVRTADLAQAREVLANIGESA